MRESDSVEELDLNQWVLRIDVEVDVDHDVEDNDEGEDDNVTSNRLDFPNHVNGGEGYQHLEHFNIYRIDCVASCVRSIGSFGTLCCRLGVALQELIEDFEEA